MREKQYNNRYEWLLHELPSRQVSIPKNIIPASCVTCIKSIIFRDDKVSCTVYKLDFDTMEEASQFLCEDWME